MPAAQNASPDAPPRYRPRDARSSPLYRIVQDHLEGYLCGPKLPRDRRPSPYPCVEDNLRAFLECGIHRFGVVRFRCEKCAEDLFLAFSCRRRGLCPSCSAKRSALTVSHAVDHLLPAVPFRQWVLVLPKRVRFFMHRRPELEGEVSRILANVIERHIGKGAPRGSPAQIHFVQRSGSNLNLHIHVHAVVTDGVFSLGRGMMGRPVLDFRRAPRPSQSDAQSIAEEVRRKVLRRFVRMGAIPPETAENMLAWPHSGFSVHAEVAVEASDRKGLERLLGYCARPALSTKRLTYIPDKNLAVYRGPEKLSKKPLELRLEPKEFITRLALLCPAPRRNQVRYHGALGPASPLRPHLAREARRLSGNPEPSCLERAKDAVSARARSWAAMLSRIFEIDPLLCPRCGGEMRPISCITSDEELSRLLVHLGLPTDFPVIAPSRSPPLPIDEDSQLDPQVDAWMGIDELPDAGEFLPA